MERIRTVRIAVKHRLALDQAYTDDAATTSGGAAATAARTPAANDGINKPMLTPQRQRMLFVALVLAATVLAMGLILRALRRHVTYLYTPSELTDAQLQRQAHFRLGGIVERGSFQRSPGQLQSHFRVTDGQATLAVFTRQMLPDLFREGQAIVATGRIVDGVFQADEVLARHNETYTAHWRPARARRFSHLLQPL